MDAGLGVRWPLSPFATAIAAGALVAAFCVALWKQHFNLKRRRNSAPESTHKDSKLQDGKDSEQSLSLTKSSSDPSLNTPKEKKSELDLISNFLRQSNVENLAGNSISNIRLPYFSNLELRPLTLSNDLRNLPRFTKIYSLPDCRKSNHPKFGTIFGINFHELILKENVTFFGSIYSHLQPLSRRSCPFIGRHYISRPEYLNINYKPIYLPFSETVALSRPHTGWNTFEGPITRAVKSVIKEEDFSPLHRDRENSNLRKRKNTTCDSGNTVNHDHNVLETKIKESDEKYSIIVEEYDVLEKEVEQRVSSPVLTQDFDSFDVDCLPSSENSEEQLTVEDNKEVPSALGNCHDIKHTEQECDTLHEVEKSINSTQASNQKPKPTKENLENVQEDGDKGGGVMTTRKNELSFALETKQTIWIGEPNSVERPIHGTIVGGDEGKKQQIQSGAFCVTNDRDVTGIADGGRGEARSQTPDEREARSSASQMDCRSGKESADDAAGARRNTGARVFESSVTSETRIRPGGVSTVVSSVTVDDSDRVWSSQEIDTILDSMSLKTVITTDHTFVDRDEGAYRPTFEEFIPVQSPHGDTTLEDTIKELNEIAGRPLVLEESPPRVSRLLGLLSRDEERRARAQRIVEQEGASIDGEWDRILRNVLASVSELERWEENGKEDAQRRRHDVSSREDAEDDRQHPRQQSRSSLTMEEEATLPTPKGETPTKVKNLRFKLDPDIFDVPSDDSFYDDDEKEGRWKKQPKYRAFSSLELNDEPVQLVSVHASVVPAGQKMVARPVGIDLRVRLTEERQSKRAHVGTSPSQAKRRSPVSENRIGWCQELSPVTENVDWRENFQSVSKENNINNNNVTENKPVPNGILKTPSPKTETVTKDSANPFKEEVKLTNGKLTNGVTTNEKPKPVPNGVHHWNAPPKRLSLPRKKFEPDPEAIERITGYKTALSKPPLPPPVFPKMTSPITKNRAEMARKQYLDSKAALSQQKADGAKKFQQFLTQAQNDRARIVTSVPDLGAIEKAVSEKWAKERASASQRQIPAKEELSKPAETPSSRGSTPDDAWASYVQSCRKHLGRRSQSLSYLETDIDIPVVEDDDKWRSTSALDEPDSDDQPLPVGDSDFEQSREDLDDSGRAKSEHELRIQRSLQSLPLPDWYKRSDKTKTGFLLKSGEKEKRGWAAAKSLASSTSSLASCGLKRPVHSLRSSRENIPWSRGSSSPDGPTLSLALARAFREPYLGWRARTSTSSGVSSSPRTSPPSWCAATTDSEANGVSFDGEDAFGPTSSEDGKHEEPPSLDDTGADAATVSMDTGELIKLPGGEDTCDDINNMSMETCEMFDASIVPDVDEPSPQADTGDDIDNLSTDTTEDKKKDPKFKRYSYSQSIYHSEWDDEESRGERKIPKEDREPSPSSDQKVIWIESSFVGSRTTTSIMVLPEEKEKLERPASR
ncbi:uncharacterized protein LOC129980827 [Argiope bruennichi]|uniref:uncharacterized protein LOC129980827 n=1 Tax=Argiope bruennichi TaxID=94029 RepID=UPI0024945067|nr:uncharacterized protein LOC129980827 [Argiope bruennichi]XP_055947208.1 uncharacterized protein LOC129980827 [Argiope bruennichi]